MTCKLLHSFWAANMQHDLARSMQQLPTWGWQIVQPVIKAMLATASLSSSQVSYSLVLHPESAHIYQALAQPTTCPSTGGTPVSQTTVPTSIQVYTQTYSACPNAAGQPTLPGPISSSVPVMCCRMLCTHWSADRSSHASRGHANCITWQP